MSTHPVGRALPALRVAALLLTFAACGDPATEPGMRTPSESPSFAQSAQDLRISPATDTVFVGQSRDLTVTTSSGAAISKQAVWTSTDTSIAVVVPTGFSTARVTGRRAGAVTITAASGPKQGTNQTTIALVPVRSVTVSPDSVMMQLIDSAQFVATPRDANGNPIGGRVIAWSIGDTTIARVTPTGVVRPRARGTTRVFATVDGIAGSANVRVNVPELSITFTAPKDSANAGDTLTVTYVARNLGDATIPDSVIIRVGLRDALGTVVVATRSGVPRMSAGPTTGVASFSLPYNLAAGTYSIVAFIDCKDILFFSNEAVLASCLSAPSLAGTIPEGNELDNSAQSNLVVRGPDLVGTSITLADSIFTRTQATVTFDFTNAGSSTGAGFDVVVGLFDATAGTYPSGTLVSNPALGSRQTRSIAVPVSIPAGLDPAHAYQVVAFADCGGASTNAAARLAACVTNPANAGVIVESSEANNSLRRGVAVASNIARIDATPDSVSFTALGDTLRLTARAYDRSNNPVDGIGFTFTSASPVVVSTTGALLRSIANGSTRIVVSAEGRSDTTRASVFQLVSRVNVFPDSLTLQSVGDTSGFAAHALDRNGNIISGASISWSSLDPAIATVSTGKVTATGVGRARIVATSNLRADTGIVSVTQDVARPTRIVASPDSVILETLTPAGATGAQLNAVTYDQNGNVIPGAWVTWQSLDPAIATVTEHGGVVAVSNGVARMTASNLVVGISDTVLAIVRQRASYIALSPDTAVIGIGGTTSIVPTLRDSLGYAINEPRAVTWTSLDPSIATVSGTSTGLVTGANLGSARVVGTLETGRADTVWIVVTAGVASSQSVRRSSSTNHLSAGPSPDPSTKTVATLRSVLDDPRRRAVLRASRR